MRKVDFVAEVLAGFWRCAEGVHGGGDDRGGGLLVVEDGEGGGDEDGEEDGDGGDPFHAGAFYL